MTYKDEILIALLECGECDLPVLSDVEYSFSDIFQEMKENGDVINLNNIIRTIFTKGRQDLEDALRNKIDEASEEIDYCDGEVEHERLEQELKALNGLNTDSDVSWSCCYSDSEISLNHYDTYMQYLHSEIRDIEGNMGFEFQQS